MADKKHSGWWEKIGKQDSFPSARSNSANIQKPHTRVPNEINTFTADAFSYAYLQGH